ncbi:MAG: hypothetical protein VX294_13070 [Candidatus Latescibacterota bacterium]|nr:hypothetical protein [Candidatus Latescibacterota bacterium]
MHTIVISKDMLPAFDLPVYGNRSVKTPTIDQLAETGTVFANCVSPCPSSAMTYSCIWVGRQPYSLQSNALESQTDVYSPYSIFSRFEELGCSTHVVWDKYWTSKGRHHALPIYGKKTSFHNLDIYNEIGIHRLGADYKQRVFEIGTMPPLSQIISSLNAIQSYSSETFTWLHCPHLLAGFDSIGSDIGYFDEIISAILELYDRSNVFLLSDHGHMDFSQGEILYGKTMHQNVLHVPLITPRLDKVPNIVEQPFSTVRLTELIIDKKVVLDPLVYSINQLPHQPNRVLSIRTDRYKYCYYKKYNAESLHDLTFDPLEQRNLLLENVYSRAKKRTLSMRQAIDYQKWEEAESAYIKLKNAREEVWSDSGFLSNMHGLAKNTIRDGILNSFRDRFFPTRQTPGRWGSKAISPYFHF